MKKMFLLTSLMGMMLAGCSNDTLVNEDNLGNGLGNQIESTRNFLTVTVLPANGMSTRAGDKAPGNYQDGSELESDVQSVRFFFFDEKDNATPVWENRNSNSYNSFIDWYPTKNDVVDGDNTQTVEKVLYTTLGLVIPEKYSKPSSVIAVVNPTPVIRNLTEKGATIAGSEIPLVGPSKSTLCNEVTDYLTGLTGSGEEGNFVMSNSVYVKDNKVVDAIKLTDSSFTTTPPEDRENDANLVTIHVERVLARLDFGISLSMKEANKDLPEGVYSVNKSYKVGDNETAEDIYVKFLRWNVTGTADKSRLVKSVNPTWTDTALFNQLNEPWNTADYHRSFWALNPATVEYQYGNFGDIEEEGEKVAEKDGDENDTSLPNINPAMLEIAQAGNYTTTYLQENANDNKDGNTTEAAPKYATKVIIAAQLCDKEGRPYELAEWNYRKYKTSDLLIEFANNELGQLYFEEKKGDQTIYTKIKPADLTFKTAAKLREEYNDDTFAEGDAGFYVYVVLSDDAKKKTWYLNPDHTNTTSNTPYTTAQVTAYIYDCINHVRVWNNGMTYYFFDVEHLGAENAPGHCGIVRNHIYKTTVKSVTGLGTPVYDPDQIIIPEQNEYDESIVTADVQILQWRIVESEYNLNWK